jgi:biopolymer transport protein ExbB/TolQ
MALLAHTIFLSLTTHLAPFLLQASSHTKAVFSPRAMLAGMGWVALSVVIILLIMSIYSLAVTLERFLTFKAAARQSREFVPKVAELLKAAQLDDALTLSQEYRKSHLAVVVNSGLQELSAASSAKASRQMRRAKRALRRATAMKTAELQRGLSSLATIGSTAPFVGLFGTVIGIFDAFQQMNEFEGSGLAVVAGGISEALIATAFGLVVAIPAVWMYNYFTNRVGVFAVEMNNSADELIEYFLEQQATGDKA